MSAFRFSPEDLSVIEEVLDEHKSRKPSFVTEAMNNTTAITTKVFERSTLHGAATHAVAGTLATTRSVYNTVSGQSFATGQRLNPIARAVYGVDALVSILSYSRAISTTTRRRLEERQVGYSQERELMHLTNAELLESLSASAVSLAVAVPFAVRGGTRRKCFIPRGRLLQAIVVASTGVRLADALYELAHRKQDMLDIAESLRTLAEDKLGIRPALTSVEDAQLRLDDTLRLTGFGR